MVCIPVAFMVRLAVLRDMTWWDTFDAFLLQLIKGDKHMVTEVSMITATGEALYNAAKNNLGVHLTLNDTVSPEVGCAECVSKLFAITGIAVPKNGIPGTAALLSWLESNPDFQEIETAEQGCVIVSATGTGNGSVRGHTGVVCAFNLMYVNDFGITSNDSNTGTLREQWNLKDWLAYYQVTGGLTTKYFRPL